MNKEIGVAGTGQHKVKSLTPLFSQYGLYTRWLKIYTDIPEEEHRDPAKVLGSKLKNNVAELADSLRFWGEFEKAPDAIAVFDVLGLSMLPTEGGKAAFGSAREILKKPENGNAVQAINRHFADHREHVTKDDWHWDAYVAGGAVAPISKLGIADVERGVSMWDDPFWFGYSQAFVEAFASEDMLLRMMNEKTIDERVVSPKSIVGLRAQYLPDNMHAIAKAVPGAKMRIIYKKTDITIDGTSALMPEMSFLCAVESAMANATPGLALQIVNTMAGFKMN